MIKQKTKHARAVTSGMCVAMLIVLASACGGGDSGAAAAPDPPVGKPRLPDLVPKPQNNVLTKKVDGRWHIIFNTIIVNAGPGDFILRATRVVGANSWKTEQDVQYSDSGAKRVAIRAPLVWGGDGHEHWHIERVASVWLVPLGPNGKPISTSRGRSDSKIGFCFYDHTHDLARGPDEPQYSAKSCGKRDAEVVGMGLSTGWDDTYLMSLPGQSIDLTGLPDGRYRLWTDIDEQGRFREKTRANNRTWIDIALRKTAAGWEAPTVGVGPMPA